MKRYLLFFVIYCISFTGVAQSFDGTRFYRLTTQWQGEGKSLDVLNDGKNNQIQLANTGDFSGQYWKITPLKNGYYRLSTQWQGEGKSLDVINDGQNNKLHLAATSEVSGQYWKITALGNGYYRLSTLWQGEGKSLDVLNDGKNNQLQLAKTGDFSGQYWKITELTSGGGTPIAKPTKPPYYGTIFVSPDILKASDPTAFSTLEDAGQAERIMFDRRQGTDGAFVTLKPYLFKASYKDNLIIEMQVNPEFGSLEKARAEARKYAEVIGRLPTVLRKDVKTSWIHKGDKLFGGGNNNLLIHTGQAAAYERDGILEEALIHEGAHSSLDATHALAKGWVAAQKADPVFISTYAEENPQREDIAESFIFFLALQYRLDRIPKELKETVEKCIPQRMAYFKQQGFSVYPWR